MIYNIMSETSQEDILQQNTKLLRKCLLMPQQSKLQALKRVLEGYVRNGVSLFNKWCQPFEPKPPQEQPPSPPEVEPTPHLRYSFHHFEESTPHEIDDPVDNRDRSFHQSSKQLESISEDPENSKSAIEQLSFETRFKKGHKRIKQDESQSSFQREAKKTTATATKEESRFYETANFALFLQMQKNIAEAKKRCKDRNEEQANSKCAEYLKYALKVGSLTTQTEANSNPNLGSSRYGQTRKQGKNLRKKILFEDESHQLYDLSKVYESLDAEKLRRQQHRTMVAENKRREQEERKLAIERMELQRGLEAQQREEQENAKRQQEFLEKERKLAQAKLLEEQRSKESEAQEQSQENLNINIQPSNQSEKQQDLTVEDAPKATELSQQLAQTIAEPIKKASEQKQQQVQLGTPVKENKQQEQSQTPLKVNPFCQPPAKTLNLQDLINNHKPSPNQNSFFSAVSLAASPPRSNIFNAVSPVNNPFTGAPTQPSPANLTPPTLPIPVLKQPPQPPPASFSAFPNPINNSPNTAFAPALPSFFPPPGASPGFGNIQNQGLGFNSSGSSSGGIPSAFPVMQTQQPTYSKNLFLDTPPLQSSNLFGGRSSSGGSANPKNAMAGRKKPQVRIS